MWSFVNTMGHPGQFVGSHNQKRDFSIHVQSVPIVPGKTFTNPNFVNKHHPIVHNYQNNFILSSVSRIDNSNLNNSKHHTNSALLNSSQSIIDKVKENHIGVKTITPNSKEEITKTEPTTICHSRKRNRRNRRNRRRKPHANNSKQNSKRQINDMMDIDLELNSSIIFSDISMSPKLQSQTFSLTDFIIEKIEKPNKSKLVKDDKSQCDTDEEELVATVVSFSPPNFSSSCIRERQLSITESEDSFIVFDSRTDEELEFSEESEDESEEEDLDSSSSVVPQKRVRFADDTELCEIHPMVQWSYAYQQARKGPWEEYARDRDRFKKRIADTEKIISPIFDAKHRENIYQKRFMKDTKIV